MGCNIYHEHKDTIITTLLLPLGHISNIFRKDGKYEYQTGCYELSCDEKLGFLEFVFTLRAPSCYSANIKSLVDISGKKLNSMKS
jgi:hypothetical protein